MLFKRNKNDEVKIEFYTSEEYNGVFPEPKPAQHFIPSWYKKMEAFPHKNEAGTLKACIPLRDAMTSGYIIPLWQDFYFNVDTENEENNLSANFMDDNYALADHGSGQVAGSRYDSYTFGAAPMKFINPWVIKTPPGWSCIISQPFNHGEDRFEIPTSIVDTDTYHTNINFPFFWLKDKYDDVIKQGTPLVQVIPFKREQFVMDVKKGTAKTDKEARSILKYINSRFQNAYTKRFWVPKKFD